uniref:Uncharacterized protein n=1 Tax=Spironucleus salmonicida TaxID=348837 RepID=V6LGZ2_9EUKA|eukprot:EST43787.1 Hypothetical protein SS50377_16404 [Spironucleus salmonicida]
MKIYRDADGNAIQFSSFQFHELLVILTKIYQNVYFNSQAKINYSHLAKQLNIAPATLQALFQRLVAQKKAKKSYFGTAFVPSDCPQFFEITTDVLQKVPMSIPSMRQQPAQIDERLLLSALKFFKLDFSLVQKQFFMDIGTDELIQRYNQLKGRQRRQQRELRRGLPDRRREV